MTRKLKVTKMACPLVSRVSQGISYYTTEAARDKAFQGMARKWDAGPTGRFAPPGPEHFVRVGAALAFGPRAAALALRQAAPFSRLGSSSGHLLPPLQQNDFSAPVLARARTRQSLDTGSAPADCATLPPSAQRIRPTFVFLPLPWLHNALPQPLRRCSC